MSELKRSPCCGDSISTGHCDYCKRPVRCRLADNDRIDQAGKIGCIKLVGHKPPCKQREL